MSESVASSADFTEGEDETNSTQPYEAIFTFENDDFMEELNWTVKPRNQSTGKDGLVAAMVSGTLFVPLHNIHVVKVTMHM